MAIKRRSRERSTTNCLRMCFKNVFVFRRGLRLEPMVIQPSARGTTTPDAHTFLGPAVLKCAVGVLQADGTKSRVWCCSNVSLWSLGRNSKNSDPAVTFMSRHQTAGRSSESSSHAQVRLSCGASLMYAPVQWKAPPQLYNFNLHGGYLKQCAGAQ